MAYNEALSLKLQDQLIREEEEAERLLDERQASRLAVEREKKARKKVERSYVVLVIAKAVNLSRQLWKAVLASGLRFQCLLSSIPDPQGGPVHVDPGLIAIDCDNAMVWLKLCQATLPSVRASPPLNTCTVHQR